MNKATNKVKEKKSKEDKATKKKQHLIKLRKEWKDKNGDKRTQEDMATELNVELNTYKNYELGNNEIPTKNLIKLADIFNVSIDYILERTSDKRLLTPEQWKHEYELANFVSENVNNVLMTGSLLTSGIKEIHNKRNYHLNVLKEIDLSLTLYNNKIDELYEQIKILKQTIEEVFKQKSELKKKRKECDKASAEFIKTLKSLAPHITVHVPTAQDNADVSTSQNNADDTE